VLMFIMKSGLLRVTISQFKAGAWPFCVYFRIFSALCCSSQRQGPRYRRRAHQRDGLVCRRKVPGILDLS
jgi:hypothetical protein